MVQSYNGVLVSIKKNNLLINTATCIDLKTCDAEQKKWDQRGVHNLLFHLYEVQEQAKLSIIREVRIMT